MLDKNSDEQALLVIDQFEELFSDPEPKSNNKPGELPSVVGDAATTTANDRVTISAMIDIIANHPKASRTLSSILTLRADYYGHVLEDATLEGALRGAVIPLGPMAPSELAKAIQTPAAALDVSLQHGLDAENIRGGQRKKGDVAVNGVCA